MSFTNLSAYGVTPRLSSRHLSEVFKIIRWAITGFGVPVPGSIKRRIIGRLLPKDALFIETGTYLGETAEYFRRRGHDVVTIEVHKPLYDHIAPRLKHLGVTALHGDSGVVLDDVMKHIGNRSIFLWLDGHYSGGITGKATSYLTPIQMELEAIAKFIRTGPSTKPIIAIDDARCFGSMPGYPSLSDLVSFASAVGLGWRIQHDIFIMTPETATSTGSR
jgi:hypothetical protein